MLQYINFGHVIGLKYASKVAGISMNNMIAIICVSTSIALIVNTYHINNATARKPVIVKSKVESD